MERERIAIILMARTAMPKPPIAAAPRATPLIVSGPKPFTAGRDGPSAGPPARLTGRDVPDRVPVTDVALGALAIEKLSRLLTKDPVTSPLRAPFTAYQGTSGSAELDEEVRGEGVQKAVGELVTCPFCTSVWVATGFAAGLVYLPRTTRLTVAALAALAGADLLQFARAGLEKASS